VHFTAFCLGGGAFFPGHGVYSAFESTLNSSIVSYRIVSYSALYAIARPSVRPTVCQTGVS